MENRKQNDRKLFWKCLGLLKPYKGFVLLAGAMLVVFAFLGFLQPLVISWLIDEGLIGSDLYCLIRYSVYLVILVVLRQMLQLLQTNIFADMHREFYSDIFLKTYRKLMHLNRDYYENKNSTEMMQCLRLDTEQVSSITDSYVVSSAVYIFQIVSGIVGLLLIDWKLSLVVLCAAPIKLLLVRSFASRREHSTEQLIQKEQAFSKNLGDDMNAMDEIKLWNLYSCKEEKLKKQQSEILEIEKYNTLLDAKNFCTDIFLEWGVQILLYLVGGYFVYLNELSIGSLFAHINYSSYLTNPISSFINLKMYFSRIFPSAKRLFSFWELNDEKDTGQKRITDRISSIEFRNVSFSYNKKNEVLRNVSFVVHLGEKVAFIGENGSGKTTILNLLLRFYEPSSGEILLNGCNINEYSLEEYRELYAVVSQDPYIFMGSILENIDLKHLNDPERLKRAIFDSGVEKFTGRMPKGLHTLVGQKGMTLSGGERQKIAVSRVFMKESPVILLDEATSGFDQESNRWLHQIILEKMKDRTVILITHQECELVGMDQIYRLDSGKIIKLDHSANSS